MHTVALPMRYSCTVHGARCKFAMRQRYAVAVQSVTGYTAFCARVARQARMRNSSSGSCLLFMSPLSVFCASSRGLWSVLTTDTPKTTEHVCIERFSVCMYKSANRRTKRRTRAILRVWWQSSVFSLCAKHRKRHENTLD